MARVTVGLLDTSIFVARESSRSLGPIGVDEVAVSIITIGELRWGVLAASEEGARSRRLDTLQDALVLEPVPLDDRVAAAWALLRQQLRQLRKKMPINDSWIAATAIANGWPLYTQDDDFPDDVPGLDIVRV